MTATEILRRLLDEHGMGSYTHEAPAAVCLAFFDGKRWHDCWESVGGEVNVTFSMTPAQAIAATFGPATRHPKPHEQWTTVLLPEIAWGWDDRWPDYLSVAHDANGEWRTYVPEATLGATDENPTQAESSGTCQADETNTIECVCDGMGSYGKRLTVHVMECTECGHVYEHVNGDYEFCPRCGRKRKDVDE